MNGCLCWSPLSIVTEFNSLPDGTIALVFLGSTFQSGYGFSANKSAAFSIKTLYLMLTFQKQQLLVIIITRHLIEFVSLF